MRIPTISQWAEVPAIEETKEQIPVLDAIAARVDGALWEYEHWWRSADLKEALQEGLVDIINLCRAIFHRVTVLGNMDGVELDLSDDERVALMAILAELVSHSELSLALIDTSMPAFGSD